MSQINVNPSDSGDRSAAAGINMVTVLIVLAFLLVVGWFLLMGPGRSAWSGNNGAIDVNINPPAQQAPAPQAPAQQPPVQQAPAQQPPAKTGP